MNCDVLEVHGTCNMYGFHDLSMDRASSICSLVSDCIMNSATTVYETFVFKHKKNSGVLYFVDLYVASIRVSVFPQRVNNSFCHSSWCTYSRVSSNDSSYSANVPLQGFGSLMCWGECEMA